MLRYFVAGNIWLLVSFVVFTGRSTTFVQAAGTTWNTYYSVPTLARQFSAAEYGAIVCVPVAASAACFILYWKSSPSAPFRFDIQTMLVVVAIFAVMLAIITAHFYSS
jgi:hypothetical protein